MNIFYICLILFAMPNNLKSSNNLEESITHLLNNKNTVTYKSIMSAASDIKYKEFKTLWEQLGGNITSPGRGGSHRILLYKGAKVGQTYHAHPNPVFNQRSIKHLIQAIRKITELINQG